jgi:MYXO-CTERM domain-containing protein
MGPGRALVGFDAVGAERSPRARVLLLDSGLEDGSGCALHADCASRFCADGVCCQTACDAPCQRCSDSGVCGQVVSDSDDLCFGAQICDAEGFCRRADGETCAEGGDCASGFCVDGVCCETACDGQCDKCNEPGTAGQCRQQSCAPYGCLPDKTCRSRCEESRHCVDDFQCVDGSCETPVDLRVVDPGCSCSSPGRAAPAPLGLALLLGALGLRRRGRRGVTARG